MTEQLKALAEAAKGWKFDHIQQCDDEPIEVGQMSDGEFYQIATIDCEQYGESSRPLAEYLVQASPERILALIAENERYRVALDRLARLGNGTMFGNSKGNNIAIEALGETK